MMQRRIGIIVVRCALALALLAAAVLVTRSRAEWLSAHEQSVGAAAAQQSTGGSYTLDASIGQPDASPPVTTGQYTLSSGFWSRVPYIRYVRFLPVVNR